MAIDLDELVKNYKVEITTPQSLAAESAELQIKVEDATSARSDREKDAAAARGREQATFYIAVTALLAMTAISVWVWLWQNPPAPPEDKGIAKTIVLGLVSGSLGYLLGRKK